MNQRELARSLSKKFGFSRRGTPRILRFLLDRMAEALARGERITLQDFGVLRPVHRAAKTIRHPKTGKLLTVPAHHTVIFRASPTLEKRLK